MKVFDILTESKQVDEGPIRFLKRTLGKNTAMGKAAQLDVEIEQEAKNIFKDFYAVAKNSPNGTMTAKGLADYLVAKGFVSKPSAVMSYINADPSMGRKVAKGAKQVGKGAKQVGKGAKKVGTAVGGAVSKAGAKVKQAMTPKSSGLTPDARQGELDLQSMYNKMSESQLMEVDAQIDKATAMKAIKKFVQQGMSAGIKSGRTPTQKSRFGDAPDDAPKAKATADAPKSKGSEKLAGMGVTVEIQQAVDVLRKAGYKVIAPKEKVKA